MVSIHPTNKIHPFYAMVSYLIGLGLVYLSIYLSIHLNFGSSFIARLPLVFPIVFSMIAIMFGTLFLMRREYGWFFRTGMMSLAVTLIFFPLALVAISMDATFVVWGPLIVFAVLSFIAGLVRLVIQGGIQAFRKYKRGEEF
ncbi:multipass membrane protein [Cuniculiplasma divulgatum]|uniref:Multipass membrane protein n=1 Tax=Cuniculiplasma divulgatum TaxID=1673428 RepID=A0A1R4A9A2_9ARCH|nr:multipass membrane protein [Cuniculiplasma divulgatum]